MTIPGQGWRTWQVGVRVVVRRRLEDGRYSDVLGDLLAVDDSGVRVATRRGEVEVLAAEIFLAKRVPPPPAPRPRRVPG